MNNTSWNEQKLNSLTKKSKIFLEASAGTGKTYQIMQIISKLFLKEIENVGVVNFNPGLNFLKKLVLLTYTEKATGELKQKLRAKFQNLLLEEKNEQYKFWISDCLQQFDEVCIMTIHGFCQKILLEFPLETKSDFRQRLVPIEDLIQEELLILKRQSFDLPLDSAQNYLDLIAYSENFEEDLLRITKEILNPKFQQIPTEEIPKIDIEELRERLIPLARPFADLYREEDFDIKDQNLFNTLRILYLICNDREFSFLAKIPPLMKNSDEIFHEDFYQKKNLLKYHRTHTKIYEMAQKRLALTEVLREIFEISLIVKRELVNRLKEKVQKRLQDGSLITFDEMIRKVANSIKENQLLREELHKRFDLCLIDEFQDTDSMQVQIFTDLFGSKDKGLFCIGDPKQAIYEFRGANLNAYFKMLKNSDINFEKFYLDQNYRSIKSMIEGYNSIFSSGIFPIVESDGNEISYISVNSPSSPKIEKEGKGIHIIRFEDEKIPKSKKTDLYHKFIVNEIHQLVKSDELKYKIDGNLIPRINYEDIAILVSTNENCKQIEKFLNENGIPAKIYKKSGFRISIQFQSTLDMLEALVSAERPENFKKLLLSDLFQVRPEEIEGFDEFDIRETEKSLIESWKNYLRNNQIPHLFKSLLNDSRLLFDRNPSRGLDWEKKRVVYRQVFQFILEKWNESQKSLEFILEEIKNHKDVEDVELDLFEKETERNTVQILTMHTAKGLEWPIVFTYDADHINDKSNYDYVELKDQEAIWIHSLWKENLEAKKIKAINQLKRLYYVALTRAKVRLYTSDCCVYNATSKNNKKLEYNKTIKWNFLGDAIKNILKHPNSSDHFEIRSANVAMKLPEKDSSELEISSKGESSFLKIDTTVLENRKNRIKTISYSRIKNVKDSNEIEDEASIGDSIQDQWKDPILFSSSTSGLLLHTLLEIFPFSFFNSNYEPNMIIKKRNFDEILQRYCLQYQISYPKDISFEKFAAHVFEILKNTVKAKIQLKESECISLVDLKSFQIHKELEFRFSKEAFPKIDTFFELIGFIDLVFEWKGKYYVVDYKSHDREPSFFSNSILLDQLVQRDFDLQKRIYSLGLYQFLLEIKNKSVPEAKKAFGGVYYLFMRGMKAGKDFGIYKDLDLDPVGLKESIQDIIYQELLGKKS